MKMQMEPLYCQTDETYYNMVYYIIVGVRLSHVMDGENKDATLDRSTWINNDTYVCNLDIQLIHEEMTKTHEILSISLYQIRKQ